MSVKKNEEKFLVHKISVYNFDDRKEALNLYLSFCDFLKDKYGLVDKDYDENPTRRGKEWLDIHHILEYELDDIANRTNIAKNIERELKTPQKDGKIVVVVSAKNFKADCERFYKSHLDHEKYKIFGCDYSLEDLKPYNKKEMLVYANKIEHFLLHCLISAIKSEGVRFGLGGGISYLWDEAISLDVYGSEKGYLTILKERKDEFYSLLSSKEITLLYKKMLDNSHTLASNYYPYWNNYKNAIKKFKEDVSYIENYKKLLELFEIIGYEPSEEIINKMKTLPYRAKTGSLPNGVITKVIGNNVFAEDGKTLLFCRLFGKKSFRIPDYAEIITQNIFRFEYNAYSLERITIPITVKQIADKTFVIKSKNGKSFCPNLRTIIYEGSSYGWHQKFANVELDNIKLKCKYLVTDYE